MLGLLFLSVLTAWKTSTERWCWSISHTMLMAQNVPLRPPPFLQLQHRSRALENEIWSKVSCNKFKFRSEKKSSCCSVDFFFFLLQWSFSVSRWRCFIFNGSIGWTSFCTQCCMGGKLTDSGPQCVPLPHRTPPAICPPVESAWGKSVWTWACLCTWASPGTGTAAPSCSRPEAAGEGHHTGYPRLTHIDKVGGGGGVNRFVQRCNLTVKMQGWAKPRWRQLGQEMDKDKRSHWWDGLIDEHSYCWRQIDKQSEIQTL